MHVPLMSCADYEWLACIALQEALVPHLEVLMGLEEAEEVAKKLCDRCKVMGNRCVWALAESVCWQSVVYLFVFLCVSLLIVLLQNLDLFCTSEKWVLECEGLAVHFNFAQVHLALLSVSSCDPCILGREVS